jgi:hypothetical protein
MSQRLLPKLEAALAAVDKYGLEKRLQLQYKAAQRLAEQLRRIEKLRHDILNLDQKTIAEIKSYSNPPEAVHNVMAATMVLLGETEQAVKVCCNLPA